jgi:hypothetical protein
MTLRQPEGIPFMVTVWGKSGIQFAGTTDIYSMSTTFPASVMIWPRLTNRRRPAFCDQFLMFPQ